jgi:hypothetical protein
MGQSQLLAAGIAALTAAACLCAQGPLYRERWADLHLELLRERVVRECQGREQDVVLQEAELLAQAGGSNPFRPAAEALASLRGVACDEAFWARAMLGSYVLPEVVDPQASNEGCRSLHVTALLPYALPWNGPRSFRIEVADATGARRFAQEFGADVPLPDLLMGEASVAIPCAEWEDGAYRLRLSLSIDGQGPRARDPVVEHGFFVLRGYQQRSEAAKAAAEAALPRLEAVEQALLRGMLGHVQRAYTGEAFDGASDAVGDLLRAERALQNLDEDKPLLAGLDTVLPAALPGEGADLIEAVLRWPATAASEPERRPLLLFLAGAPAYDTRGRRPSAPAARSGRWLARRLGADLLPEWPAAFVQSPTPHVPFGRGLPAAIAALHAVLPTDGRTIVVAELDAALGLCYQPKLLALADAVALVGAGAMAQNALEALGSKPILGVSLSGHPSGAGLSLLAQFAERLQAQGKASGYRLAPERPRPWVAGAFAAQAEIEQFVRECSKRP